VSAPILQTDVQPFAPALATLAAGAWTDILAYVNEQDLTYLGETVQVDRMAKIYLAAHIGTLTMRAGSGAAGPVTSESAGTLRRSYGMYAAWAGSGALGSTQFGQMYLDILSMSQAAGPMVL
jgi:hypothetical protein